VSFFDVPRIDLSKKRGKGRKREPGGGRNFYRGQTYRRIGREHSGKERFLTKNEITRVMLSKESAIICICKPKRRTLKKGRNQTKRGGALAERGNGEGVISNV